MRIIIVNDNNGMRNSEDDKKADRQCVTIVNKNRGINMQRWMRDEENRGCIGKDNE